IAPIGIAILAALACAPFLRFISWFGDEGVILRGADEMLRGTRCYGDLFEIIPPLGFFVVAGWFKLAGVSFIASRVLAVLVMAGIAVAIYFACLVASKRRAISAVL